MIMTPSKLRENIYNLLDQVIETGVPLRIKRKGKILTITPPKEGTIKKSKLDNLEPHPEFLNCTEQELIYHDWSKDARWDKDDFTC